MATAAQQITYTRPWVYPKQQEAIFHSKRYGLIEASTKSGKAQPLDATVYTPNGPTRMGNLWDGDWVLAGDGTPTQVLRVYPQGERDIYLVTFADGATVEADLEHLWEVHEFNRPVQVRTTKELLEWPAARLARTWVPKAGVAQFASRKVAVDPYLVGLLIGDGSLSGEDVRISSADIEIVQAVRDLLPPEHELLKSPGDNHDWRVSAGKAGARLREQGRHLRGMLAEYDLVGKRSHEKRIPEEYLYNSEEIRWSILQGLLDSDGYVDPRGQPHIEQTSAGLAQDITLLVQSLGGTVLTTQKEAGSYTLPLTGAEVICRTVYRQVLRVTDPTRCFRLSRKLCLVRAKQKSGNRMFRSIQFSRRTAAQCIAVAHPSHLYLTDGFVPTHNTQGCIIWLTEKALFGKPGQAFWWVAPSHNQAQIAYRRLKNGLIPGTYSANDTEMTLRLPTGTTMWFKTGEIPDKLYGEDVWAVVIDEASRIRADAWYAIRSTMTATRGPVRAIGNVKGRKNWFYTMCRRAEQEMADHPATTDMRYVKLTAADAIEAGIFPKSELESAQKDFPEDVFKELYFAIPAEDGGNPFGLDWIRRCIAPLTHRPVVCWGWDVAKSRDYTVGIGLDAEGYVAELQGPWHAPWRTTIERIRQASGTTRALLDSTGVGDPILEFLQKDSAGNFSGYTFNSKSKQQLMEGLAVGIQQAELHFPEGPVSRELETFEYGITRTGTRYTAPPGLHDDCVCALALAWKHYRKPDKPAWIQSALNWVAPQSIPIFAR